MNELEIDSSIDDLANKIVSICLERGDHIMTPEERIEASIAIIVNNFMVEKYKHVSVAFINDVLNHICSNVKKIIIDIARDRQNEK